MARALRLIRQHEPDLVLMERMMPKLNGLEVTARVTKELPKVRRHHPLITGSWGIRKAGTAFRPRATA